MNNALQLWIYHARQSQKYVIEKLVDLGYTNVIEFGGIIDYSGEITTGIQ